MDLFAELFDYPHHFMPDGYAGHSPRHATMFDMQITGADTAQSNPNDRIARSLQKRFRFLLHLELSCCNISVGFHILVFIHHSGAGNGNVQNSSAATSRESLSVSVCFLSVSCLFFVCFLFVAPYATYAPHPETDRLPPPRSIRPVSISVKRHVLSFRGPHAPDPRPARSG